MSSGQEVEIKLVISSAAAGRRILRAAGFIVSERRVLESNVVYDTADSTLRNSRQLLRVREVGKSAKITYKAPPIASKHKSREELEVNVSSARGIDIIFKRLGYEPIFRYEKYRTEFRRKGSTGIAMLDETPIGTYLELEGKPEWIDRTARKLGFTEGDYVLDSYARLFFNWRTAHKSDQPHMLFA